MTNISKNKIKEQLIISFYISLADRFLFNGIIDTIRHTKDVWCCWKTHTTISLQCWRLFSYRN